MFSVNIVKEKCMKLDYVNGDRLSYIPHCCNTGNVSAMRCPDASNIFQDRLCRGK